MSMVGNARYFEDGSLSMLIGKSLVCGPKKGGLPVDQKFLGERVGRGVAIQPGSRALTRHKLRCWRS
jgi:hypothetical protein